MDLSKQERADYEKAIDEIVKVITGNGAEAHRRFTSAELLAGAMLPDEAANIRVLTAVKGAHLVFTVGELKAAMKKHFAVLARKLHEAEREDEMSATLTAAGFSVTPANEREYVTEFMRSRGYDMDYHRHFIQHGEVTEKGVQGIIQDARLTAGDLNWIKPRGELLSVTEIGHAMEEWCRTRRMERREIAKQQVMTLSADRDRLVIDTAFTEVCKAYFVEPAFAEAACRKVIWSVKNRLMGRKIKQVHMIVLVGRQDSGKTVFASMMYEPLNELAIEASLQDVLDTRQMDMPQYFVVFVDELAFVERTEPAQLKTFLTGTAPSRRPMATNISERININATLLGTANHSLEKLIFDSSGMRRFVEIKPKPRKEIEPFWDMIVDFDWLGLWQSIDPLDADPLISRFKNQLMVKQEAIRNMDNTECWLRQFEPNEHRDYRRKEKPAKESSMEFYAADLYRIFRRWEEEYDPGFRTSMQRWGREMHSLLDTGRIDDWDYWPVGRKVVYAVKLPADTGQIIPLPSRLAR